jgi:dual specificity phosphatase 3
MTTMRQPTVANAHFVTAQIAVGGDLDAYDEGLAISQLRELVDIGVTHIVDVRQEWDDAEFVRQLAPVIEYLHLGIDDAGQRIPAAWFDGVTEWATAALRDPGAMVLLHCHMGINRGPSAGYAVLLALGWDPVAALDAIRTARPIANVAYAADALAWHHDRTAAGREQRRLDRARLATWRREHKLDVGEMIRKIRSQDTRSVGGAA